MSKIFKYSLGILTTCIGLLSLCNADLEFTIDRIYRSQITSGTEVTLTGNLCRMKTNNTFGYVLDNEYHAMSNDYQYCFATGTTIIASGATTWINWGQVVYVNDPGTCPTCPTCEDPYTSLECQTEYNLIPIESVTANYCHVNFGLIDPMDCPIGDGTGAIQWSALYINQQQYASNDNINITIPQDIGRSIDYTDDDADIDIEGYNADQEYIESIISNENLTPTNEDFEKLMIGLAEFLPYVFITLLMIFFIKLVNRVWK